MSTSKKWPTFYFSLLVVSMLFACSCGNKNEVITSLKNDSTSQYVLLSMDLLNAVKSKDEEKITRIRKSLKIVQEDTLGKSLISDAQKKAFWINIYNSHIQLLLAEDPSLFEDRGDFFTSPRITIANKKLSFDAIEHGIIRSSKVKLSLGLLRNPFASSYEKKFRTKETDGRVHFALNCGAKSCPLVAVYGAKNFNQKIDRVAKHFLQKVSTYQPDQNQVITSPLFSWFRGDFDGKKGILSYLKKYEVIPQDQDPSIIYDDYDWTLSLGNYYEDN